MSPARAGLFISGKAVQYLRLKPLHIARKEINLDIDRHASLETRERGDLERVRNEVHLERAAFNTVHRQAHAVPQTEPLVARTSLSLQQADHHHAGTP